jgi:hypothetical protein
MKIKSLLIGSAALMTVSTGSYAADAVVMAEPEPVEYVRVCDVYGAGFFYIPGTETCLKIGGYFRYEMAFSNAAGVAGAPSGWGSRARFAPSFDVRSETEWGTLRGFAELEINAQQNFIGSGVAGPVGFVEGMNIAHAFIELQGATGTLRMGHTQRPYARFLGFGTGNVFGGVYGYNEQNEISYTFNGGNGFSAIIAAVEDGTFNWMPDLEGGINFSQGWGSVGAIVGYDESLNTWGAKGVLRLGGANGFSGGLHVFYSSGAGSYAIVDPVTGTVADWSVLGHVKFAFSPKVAATASVQWFNVPGTTWDIVGGLDITPVSQFRIRPEIRYSTNAAGSVWGAALRFDRSF